MAIGDHTIHNIYSCTNKECNAQVAYKQKVSDNWRKKCPFCKKHSLILFKGVLSLVGLVDTKVAKTLGSISDQNKKRFEKEKGEQKQVGPRVPFWRKKRKVNFNVLRNPTNYIMTGKV